MRMWMIPPKLMCNQHLLGEHNEIHKHRHVFEKQWSIDGRMKPVVQIVPAEMERRHEELVIEMAFRGFNHQSPYELPDLSYLPSEYLNAKVDLRFSVVDLKDRCKECKERMEKYEKEEEMCLVW